MSDNSNFFGDVFDDPEDDPLLGGGDASAENGASDTPEDKGPPSWMHEGGSTNGAAGSEENADAADSDRKQIVVDQRENAGFEELNEAVGQGWRLVRLSLARPNGEQAASIREAHRFVATLEQDRPQSLFDFGATA